MKKTVFTLVLVAVLLASCLGVPNMPKLNQSTEQTIESAKKYLNCETIGYSLSTKKRRGTSRSYFHYVIYDVKKKKPNLDSLNVVLMEQFERNGFKLKDCYRISFFYCSDYHNAKLLKGFDYNGNGELVGVFYE